MRQLIAAGAVATAVLLTGPAQTFAQGATQKMATVDVKTVGTGLRASKVIGSDVVNEKKETIGKIDDLLISTDAHDVFAVISAGGFLGIGSKLVGVRYEDPAPRLGHHRLHPARRQQGKLKRAAGIYLREVRDPAKAPRPGTDRRGAL